MSRAEELRAEAQRRLLGSQSITDTAAIQGQPQSFLDKAGSALKSAGNTALYYGSDIAQSALSSPRIGLESIPATGGDVYDLLNTIYSTIGGATAPEQEKIYQDIEKDRLLPNSAEVEAVSGPHYQPKTMAGRFIQDLGATVTGGGGRHFFTENVVPTIGGEAGGAAGEMVGGRAGQAIGTIAGGSVNAGLEPVRRVMSATPEERQRLVRTLQGEDITLTGGQATGSERMQQLEVGPYANRPKSVADQQSREFTRAALRRAGIVADNADDTVMSAAQDNFGREYDNLVRANNGVVMDPTLQNSLIDIGTQFERLKGTSAAGSAVEHYFNRIADASQQNGGVIPPDVFQQIHSEISADLRASRNSPELAVQSAALRDMQDAMFDTISRNGQPHIADSARDLNRRYRNFKIIEKSLAGAGVESAYGRITPAKLGQAVRAAESNATYTQGRGEFDDLVKAGTLLNPLPNSTSAGRIIPYAVGSGLASGIGAAGSQLMAGNTPGALLTAGGTLAGATLPFVPGAVLNARPVRTSIVNRATGTRPDYFAPMTLAPLLHEGTEPVPVEPPPDEQSMLLNSDTMPAPVDLVDPRDILRRRGLPYG